MSLFLQDKVSVICSYLHHLYSCSFIIIIIMSNQPLLPPFSIIHLLPIGLQGYILYRHRTVLAGRPAFAHPCEGVHRSMSPMSLSLLLQLCLRCLVRLTWIVFVMGGKWPYSYCFVGFFLQDLFSIVRSILV